MKIKYTSMFLKQLFTSICDTQTKNGVLDHTELEEALGDYLTYKVKVEKKVAVPVKAVKKEPVKIVKEKKVVSKRVSDPPMPKYKSPSKQKLPTTHSDSSTLHYTNAHYTGDSHDSKKHGKGCMEWHNQNTYTGQWHSDRIHGTGTFEWANGCSYSG